MISRRRFNQLGAVGIASLALAKTGARAAAKPRTVDDFSYSDAPARPVALAGVPRGSDADATTQAVRKAALAATDFSWLSRGDSVLIKVVCNSGNDYPATTDPLAVHAMVTLLKERGAGRVMVGDMSGVQFLRFSKDRLSGSSRELMTGNGLVGAAQDAGAEVVAFEEAGWDGFFEETPAEGENWARPLMMPNVLLESDHVILMPRCSRHVLAGSTLGLKAAVGWWRHDSRLEYHHDAASFSKKTAESNTAPSLLAKQRLVLSSATKVLTTFGPDEGYIAEPDTGLVMASPSVVAHDMASLAWLLDNQQTATPAEAREGVMNDPNQSELVVNVINRFINFWLDGGLSSPFTAQTLERYDLDTIWDDRVLARAFEISGGVPHIEYEALDVPDALQSRLSGATVLS
ncbi:MAG: DUF362 domain-containing protein [Candidatus Binatia bacterium]|nr:DUF362 domain-containing protein [Candidatus Binatia bacterium]